MVGRPRQLDPEAKRWDELAAAQVIEDPDVASCWELIREGIQDDCIGRLNIDEIIASVREGDGLGFNELNIECVPFGSDHLVISVLDDRRTCSAAKMASELEKLRDRFDATGPPKPVRPPETWWRRLLFKPWED